MEILVARVRRTRPSVAEPETQLFHKYLERCAKYCSCSHRDFATEQALLEALGRSSSRTKPFVVLLDILGKQHTSEGFAAAILSVRDRGIQQMVFAVGPASGWSALARERADLMVSLGRVTLPHELAAVLVAEQLYRALTINAGHPYHLGH